MLRFELARSSGGGGGALLCGRSIPWSACAFLGGGCSSDDE